MKKTSIIILITIIAISGFVTLMFWEASTTTEIKTVPTTSNVKDKNTDSVVIPPPANIVCSVNTECKWIKKIPKNSNQPCGCYHEDYVNTIETYNDNYEELVDCGPQPTFEKLCVCLSNECQINPDMK